MLCETICEVLAGPWLRVGCRTGGDEASLRKEELWEPAVCFVFQPLRKSASYLNETNEGLGYSVKA